MVVFLKDPSRAQRGSFCVINFTLYQVRLGYIWYRVAMYGYEAEGIGHAG